MVREAGINSAANYIVNNTRSGSVGDPNLRLQHGRITGWAKKPIEAQTRPAMMWILSS